jgi:sulfate-transporting ATPase
MTFIMVSGYAAALVGGFVSLPLTVAGGVLIGIVRSAVTSSVSVAGLSETLGFIAVFAVLIATRARSTRVSELVGGERTPL